MQIVFGSRISKAHSQFFQVFCERRTFEMFTSSRHCFSNVAFMRATLFGKGPLKYLKHSHLANQKRGFDFDFISEILYSLIAILKATHFSCCVQGKDLSLFFFFLLMW